MIRHGSGRLVATFITVTGLLASLSAQANPPLESYSGLRPLSGDTHRHAGSTQDHVDLITLGTCNPNGLGPPHETGEAPAVYAHLKQKGYDWANLAFHINVGYELVDEETDAAYQAWISPALQSQSHVDSVYGYTLQPSTNGLRDYQTGGFVDPKYNEAKSLSSAAALRSVPGSFGAFAGREWTRGVAAYPGHTVAILPSSTTEVCSPSWDTKCSEVNESDLYRFVHRSGGVLIKAHPKQIRVESPSSPGPPSTKFFGPWEPRANSCHVPPTGCQDTNGPSSGACGFSDRAIQGIEVGYYDALNGAGTWELAFRVGVAQGYRLFPAFGSDLHRLHSGVPCPGAYEANAARGGTICWTQGGPGWTPDDIMAAMKARRCYYSSSNKPVVQIEACTESTCTGPKRIMGERFDVSGAFRVKVHAENDPNLLTPRRMSRLELVAISGLLESDVTVLAHDSCNPAISTDTCDIDTVLSLDAGAIYARACSGDGQTECPEGEPEYAGVRRTVAISAPIFVNWDAYHSQVKGSPPSTCDDMRWEAVGSGDFDDDFVYDECDNCFNVMNLDQTNADGDTFGDKCDADNDNDGMGDPVDYRPFEYDAFVDSDGDGLLDPFDSCPTVPDPSNLNQGDTDDVGNACDNCTTRNNPRVAFNFFCGGSNPSVVLTGRQRDQDHDGYGNICDLPGGVQPKCATCPLPCEAGTAASCLP